MVRIKQGDEEVVISIQEFERRVRQGDVSPLASVCIPAITGTDFKQARTLSLFLQNYDPRRVHFRRHFTIDRLPWLTLSLSLLLILCFLASQAMSDGGLSRGLLLRLGAKANARIMEDGETFRLLAANFLHKDIMHLGFNIFALVVVSSVLEGVYRRSDLMILFVASGISAMGVSTIFGTSITVGASGIVFGCLGCAVVFGWRYADVLPLRYRIYFGVVVVIYAASMFYLGFRSANTDNWGHIGGAIAGFLCGAVFSPRLLRLNPEGESAREKWQPFVVAASLVALVLAIGPLVPLFFAKTKTHTFSSGGASIDYPAHWSKVMGGDGLLTFANGVDAFAKLGCATLDEPSILDDAASRFIEGELRQLVQGGRIASLQIDVPARAVVGEGSTSVDAIRVPFSFVAEDGPWESNAFLFSRGQIECALVLGHPPRGEQSTRERLDSIRKSFRASATREQTKFQARVENSPDDGRARLSLALAHQAAGEYEAARLAFDQAESLAEGKKRLTADVIFARARFEHAFTGDTVQAKRYAALAFGVQSHDPRAGLLLASALAASGDTDKAILLLKRLQKMHPNVFDIDERLRALNASEPAPKDDQ